MALAVEISETKRVSSCPLARRDSIDRGYGRASTSWSSEIVVPVMAHGLQDVIVKLNGPRDEQGRVFRLSRHGGRRSKLIEHSASVLR